MKFRSKIDAWVIATMVPAMAVSLFAAYSTVASGAGPGIFGAAMLLVIGVVLPLWILSSTCYLVHDENLLIRSGPFRWNIPLSDIMRVVPTSSALSGPALSLDRLLIEYCAGKTVLVSPRDRAAFMRAIGKAESAVLPARRTSETS
jgi:hypothetical protein